MIRVGIAGYGVVGKRRKRCADAHPNMTVVASCDRVYEGAGTELEGVRLHSNYQDLLREDLDAVFVCLPNDLAAQTTVAGLEKGLHVFCEKPPARNLEELVKVMETERQYPGQHLMYGFNHRHHDSVQDALSIVASGDLGEIINMRGVYGKSNLVTFDQPDWRTKREKAGGGVLLDQGIHMLDLMLLFGTPPDVVHSFISNRFWGFDVEDNAYALMRMQNGIICMLNSSATQWRHRFYLDINLTKGSLVLGGILSGSKSYGAETLTVVVANPDIDAGNPREVTTRYNVDPSWQREVDEWAEAIQNGTPVSSGSSADALATMRVAFQIYHADPSWRDTYQIADPTTVDS